MIQPEKMNHNDDVLSFTVHHIIYELISHKSREEKFVTSLDYSQTNTGGFHMKAHRLSLHFSCATYASKPEGIRLSHVRSLAFFGLHRCVPSLTEFKYLRVLNLELWGDYDDCTTLNLSGLCRLFLLRYMKVSSHIYVELPSQIQGLQFLETMEIDAKMLDTPNDLFNLPSLLHLSLRGGTKLPDGIGRVTSLQTLQYFDIGNNSEDNMRSLGELINLQDLHLSCSETPSDEHLKRNLVALSSSLVRLGNLRSLTMAPGIVGMTLFADLDYSYGMPSVPMLIQRLEFLSPICTFSKFPEWIAKLQKLSTLKINVRVLLQNEIDLLAGLPVLTCLSLSVRRPSSESVVFHSGAFPVLRCFKYRCGALCLAFKDEALPNLERLKLGFNVHRGDRYTDMISGIEYLFNLREIAVNIGAVAGAEGCSDSRDAEYALKDALHKHSRFHYFLNIKRVNWIEEEQVVCQSMPAPELAQHNMVALLPDGQDKVIASTQHMVTSLAASKKGNDDMVRILPGFDNAGRVKEWDAAMELIERWEVPQGVDRRVFDSREDADGYLAAASCLVGAPGLRERAVLQAAMARLESEFRYLLLCSSSSAHTGKGGDSVDASGKKSFYDDKISSYLISPETVGCLRNIANVMLHAGYAPELCQLYGEVRRNTLMECLAVLGVGKTSLKEVQTGDGIIFQDKVRKCAHALKNSVRSLLAEERRICSQILAADANAVEECFTEAAKGCVLHLLNFVDVIIAIGKRLSDMLFRTLDGLHVVLFQTLDACQALREVLPELEALFSVQARDFIKEEAESILARLGDAVGEMTAKFSSTIQREPSRTLLPRWAIHPIAGCVIGYSRLLARYHSLLNNFLKHSDTDMDAGDDNTNMTPVGGCILMLITQQQVKIEEMSRLCEDEALQNIFLMNNLLYMLHEVSATELLKTLLGDNWIRKCRGQIRQYSMAYLRSSCDRVLSCLRDDWLPQTKGSSSALMTAPKDRLQYFNLAFEELCVTQTSWMVLDLQLRNELRISFSENILPAYRSFIGIFEGQLKGGQSSSKYIKYKPEDLENMISNLLKGNI